MMNPRYLQRFGEPPPFGDPIARAALRYDPEAPYGEPELEGTEGQRQFEPPDVQPSRNKDSMVASSAPMSQSPVTAPPSAPMENPIVRAGRERAESAKDPYLDYDPEVPIREARQSFQPPPTIESNALKSIVPPPDAPEIDSGRLPPPPVIDTRELPTEAPPENPIRRYQRELDALQAPERGPVSKWAKLAALALGAGQGYYNAANPNARPIDASEAVQNLTLGRKYIDGMGEYQRKRKDIGERIKLAGEAEDIESRIAEREGMKASRKAANDERIRQDNLARESKEAAALDKRRAILLSLEEKGETRIPFGAPLPPGMVEGGHDPLFEMGADGQPAYRRVRNPNHGLVQVPDEIRTAIPGLPKYLDKQAFQVVVGNLTKAAPTNNLSDNALFELRALGQTTGNAQIDRLTPQQAGGALSRLKPPPVVVNAGDGMSNSAANRVNSIAGQFDAEPTVKNYSTIREARDFVKTLGEGKASSPADDQGLLYSFAKAMDPNSVVREGEYNTIQKYSQSLLENFGVKVERALSNKPFLTEEAKKFLKDTIDKKYAASEKNYRRIYDEYGRRIDEVGGTKNGKKYLTDYSASSGEEKAPAQNAGPGRSGGGLPKVTTPAEYAAVRSGQKFQDENGNVRTKK